MQWWQRLGIWFVRTKFKLLSPISKRKAAEQAFRLFCTPQNRVKKPLTTLFKNAEQLEFSLDGYIIRGYRWNHPSSEGKIIQILHGFESGVVNFERYIEPLISKGYTVLAFDAPAHGRSSGKQLTVVNYINMVKQVNNMYGPVTAYIAHSFGGLSLSLALEEMPHDSHQKIVLIAPAAETTTAIDRFFQPLRLDKKVRAAFDQIIEETGGHPPSWYSVKRAAANIRAQVLFLQDKDDELTPLHDIAPIMDAKYPNFRFIISDGLGHRRIYRDDRSVAAIMEFL